MYRVENAIPAIINKDLFDEVQAEKHRRREAGATANWSITTSCFTSRIKCGMCHMSYSRSGKRSSADRINYIWICRTKRDGKKRTRGRTCTNKSIPEPTLHEVCCEILGLEHFDSELFDEQVERIEIPEPHRILFYLRDGRVIDRQWVSRQREKAWDPERRAEWGKLQTTLWDEERRMKAAERMRERATPKQRQTQSQKMKAWWADPINVEKAAARRGQENS